METIGMMFCLSASRVGSGVHMCVPGSGRYA